MLKHLRSKIKTTKRIIDSLGFKRDRKTLKSDFFKRLNFRQSSELLEKILLQNIVPFWYPEVIDLAEGGYKLNHNLQGKWQGKANKSLVSQTRTLWFFAQMISSKYGTSEHLEAARHGYKFLRERMWDSQFGGFYWEVDSSGNVVTKPDKHCYGQAFALYALSQYSMVSQDSSALMLAQELFGLLENYAHDPQHGGYREFWQQDWTSVPSGTISYLGVDPNLKLMNTHLHLLEAISTYYLLTKDRIAQERIVELILILSNSVVQKTVGACTDRFHRNWQPLAVDEHNLISYGHDLEAIWLLIESCNGLGISNNILLDFYQTLFNYSLEYGFDHKKGGFYNSGYCNKPAHKLEKIWWVQAEALISALQMYNLTQEEVYYHYFCRILDWITKYQIDWNNGDWFAEVDRKGNPLGDKAEQWKSAYHNGRAMLKCLEILEQSF
ncbi:MAG: AGE family epimerase/isomerase [Cyanobacteria bacterium J06582_2]